MTQEDTGMNQNVWPVWGHEHVVRELHAASVRGPRHAYILSGFNHLGKSTIATLFAQSLLCTQPTAPGVPCLECSACRRVARGTHPDSMLWDIQRQQQLAAEKSSTARNLTLTIQSVREFAASLAMRPLESRFRVVIVDDVETMQETAQEAFLKTLEEPPSYAVILLLTSDSDLLLETIRSRAVTLQLQSVQEHRIRQGLLTMGAIPQIADEIAMASTGRPGWAIRAMADSSLLSGEKAQIDAAASWIAADRYHQMVEATKLGESFIKDRSSVYARLSAVQGQWRRILLESVETNDTGQATERLYALKSVEECMADLDANVRPKLALQNMVLQWPIANQ